MKSRTLTCMIRVALFLALTARVGLVAQEQNQLPTRYTNVDLGTLGGTFGQAVAVNNRGWVTGFATLPGDAVFHGFLWRNSVMTDMGTFGGPNSGAGSLNERGEITVSSDSSTPDPLGEDFCGDGTHLTCPPLIWQDGVMIPLPTLGGLNGFTASINNSGKVVGAAENTTPDPTCVLPQVLEVKPVVWEKGKVRELATLFGDPDGAALAVNDNGQIVGYSGNCTTFLHAVLWQEDGSVQNLGNLGGTMSVATSINNRGQVVGKSYIAGDVTFHAFLWENGLMTDLGTLPGDFVSATDDVNSKGQVAVISCIAEGDSCNACLWQNGVMTNLNTLIPGAGVHFNLDNDVGINTRGEIVGTEETSTGESHAYLAIPTHGEGTAETAVPAATGERPRGISSENLRRMLRQRLGPRYRIPSLGMPTN